MRNNFKRQTLSMRGKPIDMDALRAQNEQVPAIGNASMNARGDILGRGGSVEIRREMIIQDYYKGKPQGAQAVSLKSAQPDVFETPAQAMARMASLADGDSEQLDPTPGLADRKAVRKLVDKEE
jgi:hypothetical protein